MFDLQQWAINFFGKYLLKYEVVVPSRHPKEMGIFSILDLHVILASGYSYWANSLKTLTAFLKRFESVDTWSSLSDIYPRSLVILYYVLLLMWAKFNIITDVIFASPHGCILGELFIRYICEMDIQIDRMDGTQNLSRAPLLAKRSIRCQELIQEFLAILQELEISRHSKQCIIREIQVYRQNFLNASKLNAQQPRGASSFEEVMINKSMVAGGLWSTWAVILSHAYSLPKLQIQKSAELFHNFGMVTQVFDDIFDVPHDMAESQPNILYAICRHYPEELAILDGQLTRQKDYYLNRAWAKQNLPLSMSAALELATQFLNNALAIDHENRVQDDLNKCYSTLSRV